MRSFECRINGSRWLNAVAVLAAIVALSGCTATGSKPADPAAAAKREAVLDALGLLPPGASYAQQTKLYAEQVVVTNMGAMTVYEGYRDRKKVAIAIEVSEKGKHGLIEGILAVEPDLSKIRGLRIYKHRESRAYGGKMTSGSWLGQFAGIPVKSGTPSVEISTDKNPVKGEYVVDGISGASITMYALKKMCNNGLSRLQSGGAELEALNLKLDEVTRATPGYPKHLTKPPHLREEVKRSDFMVPADVTCISKGKPVSCKDGEEPMSGELSMLTDGVKLSGEYDFVELFDGPQWVQVDLEAERTIYAVVVWHFYKNAVIYNDVIVQVSNDPAFESGVQTLFNNDHDNSSGQGKGSDTAYFARWWGELVDARGDNGKGTRARYVRVWTNGGCSPDDLTKFVEIGVYGK